MAELTVQDLTEAGTTLSMSTCAGGGDEFDNSGNEFLLFVNDHGSNSYNITITVQDTSVEDPQYGTLTKSFAAKACAAGSRTVVGPFPVKAYNDADGHCNITYSATPTSMKVAAIRIV